MNRSSMIVWLAGGLLVLAADAAPGQPGSNQPAPANTTASTPAQPAWTDPEFGKIAGLVTGSWKSTSPVAGAEGDSAEIVISVAPVSIPGMTDLLYAEVARADALHAPYRQTLWQFYRHQGKIRVKTIEFRQPGGEVGSLVGLWAAPDFFPAFTPRDLVTTLDIQLEPKGAGYVGKTPHPYPTSAGGAVEMTSEVAITPDSLETIDRGYGPDGKIVWGASEGQRYTYKKFDTGVKAQRLEGGVVAIDFKHPDGDLKIAQGDKLTVQYTGYLGNGTRVDTSRDKPQPFTFTQGSLIPGWNVGLNDATKGTIRRLAIPATMAYGERGAGRAIPPNSDLFFEVEILAIDRPTPPPAEQPNVETSPKSPPPGAAPAEPKKPE